MLFSYARDIALVTLDQLAPHCARIQIAGSIARQKPDCKDIDIVCIPKLCSVHRDLFSMQNIVDPKFVRAVNQWKKIKGEPIGKETQRALQDGIILDLYMCHFNNWGLITTIRTGPAEWNRDILVPAIKAAGYEMRDGELRTWRDIIPVPEERDLFTLINLPWQDPKDRGSQISNQESQILNLPAHVHLFDKESPHA